MKGFHPALLAVAILSSTIPLSAFAYGLGHVNVQSTLYEPLKVDVLLKGSAEDAQRATVKIAPVDKFAQMGIAYPSFIKETRVSVERINKTFRLILTTTKPVYEPNIQLVIEFSTENGTLYLPLTILLDTPFTNPLPQSFEPSLPSLSTAKTKTGPLVPAARIDRSESSKRAQRHDSDGAKVSITSPAVKLKPAASSLTKDVTTPPTNSPMPTVKADAATRPQAKNTVPDRSDLSNRIRALENAQGDLTKDVNEIKTGQKEIHNEMNTLSGGFAELVSRLNKSSTTVKTPDSVGATQVSSPSPSWNNTALPGVASLEAVPSHVVPPVESVPKPSNVALPVSTPAAPVAAPTAVPTPPNTSNVALAVPKPIEKPSSTPVAAAETPSAPHPVEELSWLELITNNLTLLFGSMGALAVAAIGAKKYREFRARKNSDPFSSLSDVGTDDSSFRSTHMDQLDRESVQIDDARLQEELDKILIPSAPEGFNLDIIATGALDAESAEIDFGAAPKNYFEPIPLPPLATEPDPVEAPDLILSMPLPVFEVPEIHPEPLNFTPDALSFDVGAALDFSPTPPELELPTESNSRTSEPASFDVPDELPSFVSEDTESIDYSFNFDFDMEMAKAQLDDPVLLGTVSFDNKVIESPALSVSESLADGPGRLQLELACLYAQNGDVDGAISALNDVLNDLEMADLHPEAKRILKIVMA